MQSIHIRMNLSLSPPKKILDPPMKVLGLLGFYSQALTLQGKFEFHKSLKVIRRCLGSPGKSGEAHPHLVATLAQPFVIKLKLRSYCILFKSVSVGRRSLVSTIEIIASVIKYVLTFFPDLSDNFTIRNIVCRNYLIANMFNWISQI